MATGKPSSMLDCIWMAVEIEKRKGQELTYDEWCDIRRNGTPEEIEEAVERMMQQGGYENLV